MKTDHRSIAILSIMLLAGAAMFLGCSNSPTSVDSYIPTPTPVQLTETTTCPTVDDAVVAIVAELDETCPRGASYRHWGHLNSCEKTTMAHWLAPYDGCFTKSEVKEIHVRVYEARHSAGNSSGSDGRTSPDPTPTME